jgi:hypothetical protein
MTALSYAKLSRTKNIEEMLVKAGAEPVKEEESKKKPAAKEKPKAGKPSSPAKP